MSIPRHNSEGYTDSTAQRALNNVLRSDTHPTEAQEQEALFAWAAWYESRYPELVLLHHIPNGGSRHKAEARNLKRQGVKPGVPDICLPVARKGYHGLYIELKSITGRITDKQGEWLNRLKKQGYFAVAAYGFEEAKGFIERYLGGGAT